MPQIAQLSSCELREFLNSRLLDDAPLKRLAYFPRAQRALAFAHDKLPASIRLNAVAAHVGMSSAAFSRYFAGKIGITFSYAVRVLRIERALAELEKSDCTIESLACQNGYQSGCAFTRAFKEVVGETPSEYRRRLLA